MSQKIHKLCLVRGYTEAYYQLSDEAKQKRWEEVGAALDGDGAKLANPDYNFRWSTYKVSTCMYM